MSKTLTKAEIVEKVMDETGFQRNAAYDVVETLIEVIKGTLSSGEDVLVSGFGKFAVRDKKERHGRNPATGDPMVLDARRVVTFKCSKMLRDKVNKGNKGKK